LTRARSDDVSFELISTDHHYLGTTEVTWSTMTTESNRRPGPLLWLPDAPELKAQGLKKRAMTMTSEKIQKVPVSSAKRMVLRFKHWIVFDLKGMRNAVRQGMNNPG